MSDLEDRFTKEDVPMILLRLGSAPAITNGPRLRRSTLRRLTAIPQHKKRQVHRHFPVMPPAPGSSMGIRVPGLEDVTNARTRRPKGDESDDDDPVPSMDANERRKQFLTMSNLKRVFRALDLGEDGYIDVDELHEAQKKIGGTLSKEEIRDVVWEVDDNMTGRLDMNQFLTAYRRSSADESGFEPKRFWAIVEFLLMDRDCSGEISLDEAMTTIFERQGADDLATVTRSFFRAAGVGDAEEPPPGATVSFMGYYSKVGRAKPRVPNKTDLQRSWSNQRRLDAGRPLPPKLTHVHSEGSLLPTLVSASKAAQAAENRLPRPIPGISCTRASSSAGSRSPARSRKRGGGDEGGDSGGGGQRRPATSPDKLTTSSSSGGAEASDSKNAVPGRPARGKGLAGLATLQPIAPTVGLAASALTYVGRDGSQSNAVKEKAAKARPVAVPSEAPL